MKIKTSELSGPALDWAVAIAEGIPAEELKLPYGRARSIFRYLRDESGELDGSYETGPALIFSRKWEAGGPIIDRLLAEGAEIRQGGLGAGNQRCWMKLHSQVLYSHGPTLLIAAMRCFVASKMGDEVDVPDELVPKPQADHQASVEDEARRPSPRERGG